MSTVKRIKDFNRKPDTTEYAGYILNEIDILIGMAKRCDLEVEHHPLDLWPIRRAMMDLYAEMLAEDKSYYYSQPLRKRVKLWCKKTFKKWSFA